MRVEDRMRADLSASDILILVTSDCQVGKELEDMKKSNVLLNCVAKAAQHSAKKAVNSASIWSCYQPKEPQTAAKLKKNR